MSKRSQEKHRHSLKWKAKYDSDTAQIPIQAAGGEMCGGCRESVALTLCQVCAYSWHTHWRRGLDEIESQLFYLPNGPVCVPIF